MKRPTRATVAATAALVVAAGGGITWAAWPDDHPSSRSTTAHGPRPLTSDEADRLAVARFQLYRHGGVHFHTTVSLQGQAVTVDGLVDYRRKVGLAAASGDGSAFVLEWDAGTLLAWPAPAGQTAPPSRLPSAAPARRALAPGQNATDAVLLLALRLGQDRPDNPELIRQGGAQWLRRTSLGGRPVDVMSGPRTPGSSSSAPGVDYWLTADSTLLRVEAHLGGASVATSIDLDAAGYHAFPRSPALPG